MNFDLVAPHYRWMEFLLAGEKLQRCRTAFLNRVAAARNILLVGEGNGRFLSACRQQLPSAQITVVDASGRMLAAARRRLTRAGIALDGIQLVQTDALAWKPAERIYDLIVTHFFLDCFRAVELEALVGKLALAAKPESFWLLADFQVPSRGLQRYRARVVHRLMYAFFRATTRLSARNLVPPDRFLKANDFVLLTSRTTEWGLLRTDLWARDAEGDRLADLHP